MIVYFNMMSDEEKIILDWSDNKIRDCSSYTFHKYVNNNAINAKRRVGAKQLYIFTESLLFQSQSV